MASYFLANHAYICLTREGAVLLDLKRDEYIGIGRAETRALAEVVTDWPACSVTEREILDCNLNPMAVAAELLNRNLLTTNSSAGKEPVPTSCTGPGKVVTTDLGKPAPYTIVDLLHAGSASIAALLVLRTMRLDKIVERVRTRKSVCAKKSSSASSDSETLVNLIHIFRTLRPFFYTARDHCLFDSLVLLEFLLRYGVRADWVFGVTTAPFAAHCWIQHHELVLNTSLEEARAFVPILVV